MVSNHEVREMRIAIMGLTINCGLATLTTGERLDIERVTLNYIKKPLPLSGGSSCSNAASVDCITEMRVSNRDKKRKRQIRHPKYLV